MDIKLIKKWLSTIITALMMVILFGLIFIILDFSDPSPALTMELALITMLIVLVRMIWYGAGEDKASEDATLKQNKIEYSNLITNGNLEQEDLDDFLEELNIENRNAWVKSKLGNKNQKNYPKYQKKKDLLDRWVGFFVKPITSTQILTRSNRYVALSAKDYRRQSKTFYQISSVFLSILSVIVFAAVQFKTFSFTPEKIFKFISYIFSIVFAIFSSLNAGYKNYIAEETDHLSRLTMIVNRFYEWRDKGRIKCNSTEQKTTEKNI